MPIDPTAKPAALNAGLHDLLADLDSVLPGDAESVVAAYVQAGGNGGGEPVALLHAWSASLGPDEAREVMEAVLALSPTDPESPEWAPDVAGWPFQPWQHGWGFLLLALRYGLQAATYWVRAGEVVPELASMAGYLTDPGLHDRPSPVLRHEVAVRLAERQGRLADARAALDAIAGLQDNVAVRLLDEYKQLLAASPTDLGDARSGAIQVQKLHLRLKELVAPIPIRLAKRRAAEEVDRDEGVQEELDKPRRRRRPVAATSPGAAGASLEEATLAMLRRLFELSAEQSEAILNVLRRQKSGYQFGHDLAFEATVAGTVGVRCHVECKNYNRAVAPADVADKLLQQKAAAAFAPIDHWVLISPHSDPSNDLEQLLNGFEASQEFPFSVQVWSPQSGIRDLFAVVPDAFRRLYAEEPPPVDANAVVSTFLHRVQPFTRLAPSLRAYPRDPWRMCFNTEDVSHFAALLSDHVPLATVDAAGRPLGEPLHAVVDSWIADRTAPTNMLLLGEFGDGKSFFTYLTCRRLAETFLAGQPGAVFPVRLALKELHKVGSADGLLDRWLRDLGASRAEWLEVAASVPTFIVLDGFDEMTSKLDPPTVAANLELLTDALERLAGPATDKNRGRKALVTSRGRFFDQPREEAALRERLGQPVVRRIRPISRTDVLANLSAYAKRIEATDKLARLRTLYDPIGLAAKPLFLQMIKETLELLPDDEFDATTLYETYINASLERKSALLRSEEPYELAADVIAGLRLLLEQVAVRIHVEGGAERHGGDLPADETDLRTVAGDTGLSELLWRMTAGSADGRAEHDARMRVAVRSLLRPVASDDQDAWRVSFFHRSVLEYFLAAATARAIAKGDADRLVEILSAATLSIETVDFVAQRSYVDADAASMMLAGLALSAPRGWEPATALGGNAMSLAYRLSGRLPDVDWRGLHLDSARLVGADLRGRDLTGSSLRFVNFDNADLRGINLEGADLTGLRVEQTTGVTAIAFDVDGSTLIVGYSDGTIREWVPEQVGWSRRTVASNLDAPPRWLTPISTSAVAAVTARNVMAFGRTHPAWTVTSLAPRSPFLVSLDSRGDELTAVHATSFPLLAAWSPDNDSHSLSGVDASSPLVTAMEPLISGPGTLSKTAFVSGRWLLSSFFVDSYIGPRLWHLSTGDNWWLPEVEFTSFTVVDEPVPTVFVGCSDGSLFRAELGPRSEGLVVGLTPVGAHRHDGPITSVAATRDLVATGGVDRCVRVSKWQGEDEAPAVLALTLRCAGARLNGVEGPAERLLLERLAANDAERDGEDGGADSGVG